MNALLKLTLAVILFSTIPANAGEAAQQGRYQIVINPSMRADTFLLDTWTGKVWQQTQFTDMYGEPSVWLYMDRIDSDKQNDVWRKNHSSKKEVDEFEKRYQSKEKKPADLPTPP